MLALLLLVLLFAHAGGALWLPGGWVPALVSRQEDGVVVDASAFLRRAWHSCKPHGSTQQRKHVADQLQRPSSTTASMSTAARSPTCRGVPLSSPTVCLPPLASSALSALLLPPWQNSIILTHAQQTLSFRSTSLGTGPTPRSPSCPARSLAVSPASGTAASGSTARPGPCTRALPGPPRASVTRRRPLRGCGPLPLTLRPQGPGRVSTRAPTAGSGPRRGRTVPWRRAGAALAFCSAVSLSFSLAIWIHDC